MPISTVFCLWREFYFNGMVWFINGSVVLKMICLAYQMNTQDIILKIIAYTV